MPVCVSPVYTPPQRPLKQFGCLQNLRQLTSQNVHSLDVNPSCRHLPQIRLPVRAFPLRHCQKSPISPRHLGRRNTLVNIRLIANVPQTLHTDAQLPWYGNSLLTSVPLCLCRLAFRRACRGAHELVSHELMSCSILAFGIGFVIKSAGQPSSWRTGLTWKPPVSRGFACQHASFCPVPCD